ncbi:MAG: cupin domain-containing protein [Chlamydiota bacterium]
MTPILQVNASIVNEHLTIYPLIPFEAGHGWSLELLEPAGPLTIRDVAKRQWIVLVEGELWVAKESESPVLFRMGESFSIDPGFSYTLIPEGRARCFSVTWKNDVPHSELEQKYLGERIDAGDYGVYELIGGDTTEQKWSAALLDIQDSPRHFHRIETEHFIVAQGTLKIEIDGQQHLFETGDAVVLYPGMIHQLTSATDSPVQVLCFNFPAFDPSDLCLI